MIQKQRTIDSASAFAAGLFASSGSGALEEDIQIHRTPIANDTLLRFYDTNSTYDDEASAREDAVVRYHFPRCRPGYSCFRGKWETLVLKGIDKKVL